MGTLVQEPATDAPRRRRWRFSWVQVIACLVILVGTVIFLYPSAASWFSQKEQSRVTSLAQESLNHAPNNSESFRTEQIRLAHAYNDALASGAIFKANANIATSAGTTSDEALAYRNLLAVTESGFMGRLRYDSLAIDLPIYHGTDEATLARGVGHLEGTSLPVGGIGTRSVLTAHRGLPEATLFNELDKAKVGDVFTLSILDQVLTYQVIEMKVIEPNETEEILADLERDLVTLVTCTPLGINSHRILVTGERITPTPIEQIVAATAAPVLPGFPWWVVALVAVVSVVGLYFWRSGYTYAPAPPSRRSPAHAASPRSAP